MSKKTNKGGSNTPVVKETIIRWYRPVDKNRNNNFKSKKSRPKKLNKPEQLPPGGFR